MWQPSLTLLALPLRLPPPLPLDHLLLLLLHLMHLLHPHKVSCFLGAAIAQDERC
jgi:hypothetical protein